MNEKDADTHGATSDEDHFKSYRDVSADTLREFYMDQIELGSIIQVAARVGLRRTTLQGFLAGAKPHPRTHRALAMYYLHAQEVGSREDALRVLAGDDRELHAAVLDLISEHLTRRRRPVPLWVNRLKKSMRVPT